MEMVKKYLFWACTPIGVIVAVAAGWMAISSTANELNTQKQQLENQKKAISTLRSGAAAHPNQGTIDAISAKREELVTNVHAAWVTLEQDQQSQNRWTGLADRAIQEVEGKNFLDTLSSTTLQSYLLFARNVINGLPDNRRAQENRGLLENPNDIRRVQPRRLQDGQWVSIEQTMLTESRGGGGGGSRFARGGGGGGASQSTSASLMPGDQLRGKVVWNSPDLDFTMKDWGQQPQSFEVWLTQEDLWVYQALLWVIAESNKGADVVENGIPIAASGAGSGMGSGAGSAGGRPLDLSRSVVKEIIELAIGRRAAVELEKQSSRRIGTSALGMGSMGGGMGGMDGGMGSMGGGMGGMGSMGGGMGGMGGGMGGGMMSGAEMAEMAKREAMMGRYVDAAGAPLTEPDFTGQFRRMPVYLNLRVDQRYISDVLVNCANCPMPIDVLWVTVNPGNTQPFDYSSAAGTSAMGGSMMGSSGRGTGGSSGPMRSSGGGSRGASGSTGNVDFGHHEVIVEIFGCINIFAPPSKDLITGGNAAM